jgi:hypothetical protein
VYDHWKAADSYARSNVMTAGRLKSYQLLLERALLLIQRLQHEWDANVHTQLLDIIAQLQAGMNLQMEPARNMFRALGLVWDAVQSRNLEVIQKAREPLLHLKITVDLLQKRLENPRAMGTLAQRELWEQEVQQLLEQANQAEQADRANQENPSNPEN